MSGQLFQRNLNRCGKPITIQNRSIVAPAFGSPDFDEEFTGDIEVTALVNTKRGKTLFDGVATDQVITHKFCMHYIEGVTDESWVLFKGRRFDIIDVENCCENDKRLTLSATERGTGEAAKS